MKYYDQEARTSLLMLGDQVLVRKKGVQGKHKICDIWENSPNIVKKQPIPDITNNKPCLLHWNMIYHLMGFQDQKMKTRPQKG